MPKKKKGRRKVVSQDFDSSHVSTDETDAQNNGKSVTEASKSSHCGCGEGSVEPVTERSEGGQQGGVPTSVKDKRVSENPPKVKVPVKKADDIHHRKDEKENNTNSNIVIDLNTRTTSHNMTSCENPVQACGCVDYKGTKHSALEKNENVAPKPFWSAELDLQKSPPKLYRAQGHKEKVQRNRQDEYQSTTNSTRKKSENQDVEPHSTGSVDTDPQNSLPVNLKTQGQGEEQRNRPVTFTEEDFPPLIRQDHTTTSKVALDK